MNVLYQPRPVWLLILASIGIGAGHALAMLPLGLIAGTSAYWTFPKALITDSGNDMGEVLAGYLYLAQGPWLFPLLHAPLLGPPPGVNVFWLDPVPFVALLGKLLFSATGILVNPYGIHLFACLALPGAAMTALLAIAGQRNLLAAIAGSVLAETTPYLLWRWGHMALMAHFLIILALAFYLWTIRHPVTWRTQVAWAVFLCLVLLTNIYLFAMVAAIWAASIAQKWFDAAITSRGVVESAAVGAAVLPLMIATGLLSGDLGSAGNGGFGFYSMNLLSPFIPQMSGLLPAFSSLRIGHHYQYEGFAYLGAGVLLLVAGNFSSIGRWLVRRWRAHLCLLVVLTAFFLLALSNRIYAGAYELLEVPLPSEISYALAIFRSSGRFFWPIGYAGVALVILRTLRNYAPGVAAALLSVAALLQWIDAGVLRAAIAESATHPARPALDRQRLTAMVARSEEVMVFPTYNCVNHGEFQNTLSLDTRESQLQANMEIELTAARASVRTNSVYTGRNLTDCEAEQAGRRDPLRRDVLYVYLTDFTPAPDQIGGSDPATLCESFNEMPLRVSYCRIPPTHAVRAR